MPADMAMAAAPSASCPPTLPPPVKRALLVHHRRPIPLLQPPPLLCPPFPGTSFPVWEPALVAACWVPAHTVLWDATAAACTGDPTVAMATTTTTPHSRILACTAMISLLLLTAATPGAQGRILRGCPCGETYVVRGGESLQMISEKCNDQFILENNPHIVDHDDLFEGQLLKMDCTQRKVNLCDITGALPAYFC